MHLVWDTAEHSRSSSTGSLRSHAGVAPSMEAAAWHGPSNPNPRELSDEEAGRLRGEGGRTAKAPAPPRPLRPLQTLLSVGCPRCGAQAPPPKPADPSAAQPQAQFQPRLRGGGSCGASSSTAAPNCSDFEVGSTPTLGREGAAAASNGAARPADASAEASSAGETGTFSTGGATASGVVGAGAFQSLAHIVEAAERVAAGGAPGDPRALEAWPMLSLGSVAHGFNTCTPCHYVHARVGCFMGKRCGMCHYRHRKARKKRRPTAAAAASSADGADEAFDPQEVDDESVFEDHG